MADNKDREYAKRWHRQLRKEQCKILDLKSWTGVICNSWSGMADLEPFPGFRISDSILLNLLLERKGLFFAIKVAIIFKFKLKCFSLILHYYFYLNNNYLYFVRFLAVLSSKYMLKTLNSNKSFLE